MTQDAMRELAQRVTALEADSHRPVLFVEDENGFLKVGSDVQIKDHPLYQAGYKAAHQSREAEVQKALMDGRTQGIAIAVANAVRQESWYPDELLGGVKVSHMIAAGVEPYDYEVIRAELLNRGKDDQAALTPAKDGDNGNPS